MKTSLTLCALISTLALSTTLAQAQHRVSAKSAGYQPRQASVVNIFALAPSQPAKEPVDPFSDIRPTTSPSVKQDPVAQPSAEVTPESSIQEKDLPALASPAQGTPTQAPFSDLPNLQSANAFVGTEAPNDAAAVQELIPPGEELPAGQGSELESLPAPQLPPPTPSMGPSQSGMVILTGDVSGLPPLNYMNRGQATKSNNPTSSSSQLPTRMKTLPTAVYRRPSRPTPTINMMQPAIVQVPATIRVIPTYVGYPYYPAYYPYPYPYFPAPPAATDSKLHSTYGRDSGGSEGISGRGQQFDYSYHRATDQNMFYSRDPNLVGYNSHSVNYVSYPHNYLSYPSNSHYGLHIQSFPVTRRLDR